MNRREEFKKIKVALPQSNSLARLPIQPVKAVYAPSDPKIMQKMGYSTPSKPSKPTINPAISAMNEAIHKAYAPKYQPIEPIRGGFALPKNNDSYLMDMGNVGGVNPKLIGLPTAFINKQRDPKPYDLSKMAFGQMSKDRSEGIEKPYTDYLTSFGIDFTPYGQKTLVDSKIGNMVTKPLLRGAYEQKLSDLRGEQLLYGTDLRKSIKGYKEQMDKMNYDPATGLLSQGIQGVSQIFGQMGANYSSPEAVGGALIGGGAGFKIGAAKNTYESSVGRLYQDMLDAGVAEDTAKSIAMLGGVGVAGIEYAQLGNIAKGLNMAKTPVAQGAIVNAIQKMGATEAVESVLGKKLGSFVRQKAVPVLGASLKNVLAETGQEVAQEGISIGAENLGKSQSNIPLDSMGDVANRLKDTAISSALTFGLMNVPGAIGGMNHNVTNYDQNLGEIRSVPPSVMDKPIDNANEQKQANFAQKQAITQQLTKDTQKDLLWDKQDFAKKAIKITQRMGAEMDFFEGDPSVFGYYDNGKIHLNVNSNKGIEGVYAHELTHFLKNQANNSALQDYENLVFNEDSLEILFGTRNFGDLINQTREKYLQAGKELTGLEAKEEVLADATRLILSNDNNAIDVIAKYDTNNVLVKIYNYITDMIRKLGQSEESKFYIDAQRKFGKAISESTGILQKETDGKLMYSFTDKDSMGRYSSDSQVNQQEQNSSTNLFNGADVNFIGSDGDSDVIADSYTMGNNRYMLNNSPTIESDIKTRETYNSVVDSSILPDPMKQEILSDIQSLRESTIYQVQTNKNSIEKANATIETMGVEKASDQLEYKMLMNEAFTAEDTATAIQLMEHYANQNDKLNFDRIISTLALMNTQAGQSIQMNRLIQKMSPIGQVTRLKKMADKMNETSQAKFGEKGKRHGKNPHKEILITEIALSEADQADILNSEPGSKDMERAVAKAEKSLYSQTPNTWWDKWNALRITGMLGNPRTHVRNIIGNTGFMPVKYTKDVVGGAMEAMFLPENAERTKTILPVDRDLILVADVYFDNYYNLLAGHGKENTFLDRKMFNSKLLESIRLLNSKALEAEDVFFLKHHFKLSFAKYLKANSVKAEDLASFAMDRNGRKRAVLTGSGSDIEGRAVEYAVKEAQKATYRDANKFSDWLNATRRRSRKAEIIVDTFAPFRTTPANIVRRGMEYSPLGLMKGISQLRKKGDNVSVTDIIDTFSAGATGTVGIMGLGLFLASMGIVTGNDDESEDKTLSRLEGNQNYALVVGPHSYTLDWAAPVSLPFFMGVEIYNATKGDDGGIGRVLDSMTKISDPMINMSMLQGINNVFYEIKYSENASEAVGNVITSSAVNYAGQGFPTIGGQVARILDDTRRTKYIDKNSKWPEFMQELKNGVQSKTPIWSQQMPAYIDPWGQEEKTGGLGERIFSNMISPGFYKKNEFEPVNEALRSLYVETGDKGVLPKASVRSVSGNYGKKLTAKEYEAYNKQYGQLAYDEIKNIVQSSVYQQADTQDKADMIEKAFDLARNVTQRDQLSRPEDKWVTDYKGQGGNLADYISLKNAQETFKDTKKQGTTVNPFENLQLEGEKREKYILEQMSDNQQYRYQHLKTRGMSIDTYYRFVKIMNAGENKENKIRLLVQSGMKEGDAYRFYQLMTSKKYGEN